MDEHGGNAGHIRISWTGWIGFAAIMLTLIGSITFFEGLVAIIRDEYYVVTGKQVLLFDLTTWGWIMLFWGVLLFLAGLGLAAGSGWARWFAIFVVALNLFGQLGIPRQHAGIRSGRWSCRVEFLNPHRPLRTDGALGAGGEIRLS